MNEIKLSGFISTTLCVKNMPNFGELRKWTVLRLDHGQLWFYGTYDDADKAEEVANELGNAFAVEERI